MANWKTERRESGTSGARYAVVEDTKLADWGIVINMPCGPFAMGAVCALVCTANIPAEEAEDRARIIAAAPELLDACKAIVLHHKRCLNDVRNPCWGNRAKDVIGQHWGSERDNPITACAYCHARAAIAKAEGRRAK